MSDLEEKKRAAALVAVQELQPGMRIGLGTGSTARHAIDAIGAIYQEGKLAGIRCVSTSEQSSAQAAALGLPLVSLAELGEIDVAIDGADEISPALDLIKGLGGALLREKQVERLAKRFLVVADDRKLVASLGSRCPVPVEVRRGTTDFTALTQLGARAVLRQRGDLAFISDNGNNIVDCYFDGGIIDPNDLALKLSTLDIALEHGLFLGMATEAIIATAHGIQRLPRPS